MCVCVCVCVYVCVCVCVQCMQKRCDTSDLDLYCFAVYLHSPALQRSPIEHNATLARKTLTSIDIFSMNIIVVLPIQFLDLFITIRRLD